MASFQYISYLFEYSLLFYFGFASVYFFVFAFAALFYKEKEALNKPKKHRPLVLIPSYKEDKVIVETAQKAACHFSENSNLDVTVIADSLKTQTLQSLEKTGVKKSTKVKSLKFAIENTAAIYDYVLVLDADNIMAEGCLDELIQKVEYGFRIVQGHRLAKNHNTNFAVLDGISEEVNNSIFRKGHRVLGLSAALIGSGFITEYQLLKEFLECSEAVGGFDKDLELKILKEKIPIAYAQKALIYDEKVQKADAFVNQRRRWLSAQILFFRNNISSGLIQLIRYGNIDYFDKLIQFMLPPRIIALGATFFVSFLYLVFNLRSMSFPSPFFMWLSIASLTALAVLLSIPRSWFKLKYLRSLGTLPIGFIYTLLALLKSKGANKQFLHTPHGVSPKTIK